PPEGLGAASVPPVAHGIGLAPVLLMRTISYLALMHILTAASAVAADGGHVLSRTRIFGSFRLSSEVSRFTDFATSRSPFRLRARVDLDHRVSEELGLFLQPQFAKSFGELAAPAQATSGTTFDTSLGIHQAYLRY